MLSDKPLGKNNLIIVNINIADIAKTFFYLFKK